MKIKFYFVYDKVAGCYSQPKGFSTEAVAKRAFAHELSTHPYIKDLDLYTGCSFDVVSGKFEDISENLEFLCHADELIGGRNE